MTDLQKGDVIQLKSGGPLMTVQGLGEYTGTQDGVHCVWFDGKGQHSEVFECAVLTKVEQVGGCLPWKRNVKRRHHCRPT